MREIKFRAWYIDSGHDEKQNFMYYAKTLEDITTAINYGYQLMQYTGLKDKNGKEIYEGDIIITRNKDGSIPCYFEVEFFEGAFYPFSSCFRDGSFWCYNKSTVEVVGNIFENPGLLKKSSVDDIPRVSMNYLEAKP